MIGSDIGAPPREAGSEGSSALQQAKADAGRLAQLARARASSYLDERKMHVADNIVGVAKAAHSAARQLDQHGNAAMAEYIDRAANGLERFSGAIRDRDIALLMNDAEDFARHQPAVFIGAGVAIGFLLARFLRSSSERRYAERHGYGSHEPADGAKAEADRRGMES